MTDTPDTSPKFDPVPRQDLSMPPPAGYVPREDYAALSAQLDKKYDDIGEMYIQIAELRAERDALKEKLRHVSWMGEGYALLEADRNALKAELAEAVEVLQNLRSEAWGYEPSFESGFHSTVYHKCEDFLARHQKETDT